MQLISKSAIKNLLKNQQAAPQKRLGQNFLIDKTIIKRIIKAANIQNTETVLEIGPGIGVLTRELAKQAKKVIAVEKDRNMVAILKETLRDFKNVEIIEGDALKINFQAHNSCDSKNYEQLDFVLPWKYKLVANLPFYITASVIRKFLEAELQPKEMVLLVQKQVAQRIAAKPPRMSILAVSVQVYAEPKIISYVSKKSFYPQPKVDGAIIKITPFFLLRKKPAIAGFLRKRGDYRDLFFKIVKAGFKHPRKQLINNLSAGLKIEKKEVEQWLLKNEIQPQQRAETLTVENWVKLTKSFKNFDTLTENIRTVT